MHYSLVDFVLDIYQNAVEADSRTVRLDFFQTDGNLDVVIEDDGKGMDENGIGRAKDPFYSDGSKHVRRKVGLGLPFLIQATESSGGRFDIESEPGKGTRVSFGFDLSNIDTPPLGSVPELILAAMTFGGPEYELVLHRTLTGAAGELDYRLSRKELADAVGDFRDASSLVLLRQFIMSQEEVS